MSYVSTITVIIRKNQIVSDCIAVNVFSLSSITERLPSLFAPGVPVKSVCVTNHIGDKSIR